MIDARPMPDRTRREGVHALPVVLADGRTWGFALPSIRLRPEVVAGLDELGRPVESIRVVADLGHPPEVRRWVDALKSACERGTPPQQYESLFALASALLRLAHDVDPSEAATLLESGVVDLPGLVEAVLSATSGAGPAIPGPTEKEVADA